MGTGQIDIGRASRGRGGPCGRWPGETGGSGVKGGPCPPAPSPWVLPWPRHNPAPQGSPGRVMVQLSRRCAKGTLTSRSLHKTGTVSVGPVFILTSGGPVFIYISAGPSPPGAAALCVMGASGYRALCCERLPGPSLISVEAQLSHRVVSHILPAESFGHFARCPGAQMPVPFSCIFAG